VTALPEVNPLAVITHKAVVESAACDSLDAQYGRCRAELRAAEAKLGAVRFLVGGANPRAGAGHIAVLLSHIDLIVGEGSGHDGGHHDHIPPPHVYRWAARQRVNALVAAGRLTYATDGDLDRAVTELAAEPWHAATVNATWVEAAAHHNR
jgi:hypothetical protein